MNKRDWSCLLFGFILTTSVACKPITEEDKDQGFSTETASITTPTTTTGIARQPTITSLPEPEPTDTSLPEPPPDPTSNIPDNWQQIGSASTGLQIAIPPGWVNLSGQLDTRTATNPLGLTMLFAADSRRTGSSLLAAKGMDSGAFMSGLIANFDLPDSDPFAGLAHVLTEIGPAVTPINQTTPITATLAATLASIGAMGAYVDVTGGIVGFPSSATQNFRTRILLFASSEAVVPPARSTQAIFLLSTLETEWNNYNDVFAQMVETIIIHNLQSRFTISSGATNIMGDLTGNDIARGNLSRGSKDVWTLSTDSARYATLTVSPDDKDIDLTLAIFGPSGQTVTRIDNGYAGDTEVATDVLLTESGRYIIEVGEFFNQPGRYTLSLVLTEEPLYGGGGRIETGQGIQSVLPINGQHLWLFDGTAEQLVSIVLEPEDNFDAILDLYGPDGRRLVALDEGFSGDAEVISGFELPITGQYSIMVRSFAGDGGAYTLSLDEGGEDTLNYYDAGDLAYGDTKRETLRPHEAHAWFFQAKAGDEVMVEVAPLNDKLDLDIWLLDPGIKRLAAADSFLAGMAETIVLTLPQDGQYLVLVRDYFGEAGEYEIRLMAMPVATPEPVGMIQYDETMTAILMPGQTVIWFFSGNQGDVIDINLTPTDGNSDLLFLLQHPNGNTVLEVDEALANNAEELKSFALTADGQWGIVVKEFFAAGGPYSLTVHKTQ